VRGCYAIPSRQIDAQRFRPLDRALPCDRLFRGDDYSAGDRPRPDSERGARRSAIDLIVYSDAAKRPTILRLSIFLYTIRLV
jgi:hypothetical protein